MIATLPIWVQDIQSALPLIIAFVGFVGWIARRWRRWMVDHIVGPIADLARLIADLAHLVEYHTGPNSGAPKLVDRVVDLSARVQTLEIVHHTQGVTATEVTQMLINREPPEPQHKETP